jgi:hypothetical protein
MLLNGSRMAKSVIGQKMQVGMSLFSSTPKQKVVLFPGNGIGP